MILNFDYGIQLSIIHDSKYCLMPVTFYRSVLILGGGSGIRYFVTPAPYIPYGYKTLYDASFVGLGLLILKIKRSLNMLMGANSRHGV